ncbi:hypothetical protein ACFLT3_00865 [Chloroflexota bacterium]
MTTEIRVHKSSVAGAGAIDYRVPAAKDISPELPVVKKEAAHRRSKLEDLAYGEPVYWLTIIGSLVVIIGGLIAFLTTSNFIDPGYWISSVWQGLETEEIWEGAGSALPNGHWYLSHIATGDGLQCVGLALALVSITVGLITAAVVLFRKKSRVFGIFALVAAVIITVAIFI